MLKIQYRLILLAGVILLGLLACSNPETHGAVSAGWLWEQYKADPVAANQVFAGKAVKVKGEISAVIPGGLYQWQGVVIELDGEQPYSSVRCGIWEPGGITREKGEWYGSKVKEGKDVVVGGFVLDREHPDPYGVITIGDCFWIQPSFEQE